MYRDGPLQRYTLKDNYISNMADLSVSCIILDLLVQTNWFHCNNYLNEPKRVFCDYLYNCSIYVSVITSALRNIINLTQSQDCLAWVRM